MASMTNQFTELHEPVGTMAYPPGPVAPPTGPHASIAVCGDETCQELASDWVEGYTGHPGVFEPFGSDKED